MAQTASEGRYGITKKLLIKLKKLLFVSSIGDGLSFDPSTGELSVTGGGGGGTTVVANPEGEATSNLNKLQVGESIYGIPIYSLPIAGANTLGGVKIGSGITVAADGTISAIPINVFRELAKAKVQAGTPTAPTVVQSRATNVTGGYVEEFVSHAQGLNKDNYMVYWDVEFNYQLSVTAGQVYGAVFENIPIPKTWGNGYSNGAVLYNDSNDMLVIYEVSGTIYAQLTCTHDYSVGQKFNFYGFYPISKDVS